MIYFQSLTKEELTELLKPLSRVKNHPDLTPEKRELKVLQQARYRSKQIFHWVYQRHQTDWDQMSDLAKDLRAWLKENVEIYRLSEHQSRQALDGTHKFLWNLKDLKTIESVIIPAALQEKDEEDAFSQEEKEDETAFAGRPSQEAVSSSKWSRLTACISSQVGCAMACKFCLTGVQGLDRHLATHEIVTQVFELRTRAPITNIVFMGMGEPLHNLENVIKACKILLDQDGLGFSKRKVTVSTSGLVPAIEELGRNVDVSLAISLNGTTDEQRTQIMPVNKKWNLEALLSACRRYPLGSHRRITFEYVMLKGVNDQPEHAAALIKLLHNVPAKVNLIPFNPFPLTQYERSTQVTIDAFRDQLVAKGINTITRKTRGDDIDAACGQLAGEVKDRTSRSQKWQKLHFKVNEQVASQ